MSKERITYKQIGDMINKMTVDQKWCDVTVLLMNEDEVFHVSNLVVDWDKGSEKGYASGVDLVDGVLDENHPFFIVIT